MLTLDDARRIAVERIGRDYGLIESATAEKTYGWYFIYQTKKFLETGNPLDMAIGSGGFIVDREDGHVLEFGSGLYVEQLEAYEAGFRYDEYDLEIHAILNFDRCVEVLLGLGMRYVEHEEEHGVVWRIPQRYTRKVTERHLKQMPCKFSGYTGLFAYRARTALNEVRCCTYVLIEHRGGGEQRQV